MNRIYVALCVLLMSSRVWAMEYGTLTYDENDVFLPYTVLHPTKIATVQQKIKTQKAVGTDIDLSVNCTGFRAGNKIVTNAHCFCREQNYSESGFSVTLAFPDSFSYLKANKLDLHLGQMIRAQNLLFSESSKVDVTPENYAQIMEPIAKLAEYYLKLPALTFHVDIHPDYECNKTFVHDLAIVTPEIPAQMSWAMMHTAQAPKVSCGYFNTDEFVMTLGAGDWTDGSFGRLALGVERVSNISMEDPKYWGLVDGEATYAVAAVPNLKPDHSYYNGIPREGDSGSAVVETMCSSKNADWGRCLKKFFTNLWFKPTEIESIKLRKDFQEFYAFLSANAYLQVLPAYAQPQIPWYVKGLHSAENPKKTSFQ